MADEFLLNLSYTPRQHAGRNGIRLNRAYDVAGALLASGVVTSTTSWTALAVPTGMTTDRGILFMYNLGSIVVRIRSASGTQFGELPVTSDPETEPAFPFLCYTNATSDIQHSTASGSVNFYFEWYQR